MCNNEKNIINFYKKYTECRDCKSKRSTKRYYASEDILSNQQKVYFEKNRNRLLQKQNENYMHFKILLRNYGELENRLKALEDKFLNIKLRIKTDVYYFDDF